MKNLMDLDFDNILEDLNDFDVVSIDTLQLLLWGAEDRIIKHIGIEAHEKQSKFIDRIKEAIRARTY